MYAEPKVEGRGNNLRVVHGDDSNLFVKFYWNKIEEAHFVHIMVPGDKNTVWDRPVREDDKKRWPRQWEAYMSLQNQFGNDTMLEDFPVLNDSQVDHFKSFNIHTVEQLAGVTDGFIDKLGIGAREIVKKAQIFLNDQKEQAEKNHLQKELESRDKRIATLESQLEQLMQGQEAPKTRKPRTSKKKKSA